ncbi:UDP-N-acetylmuramate--L-alanine ligase [Candidatus Peribacteria bacterium]|nr:MAG: UDP-N-acetylmuramate--L-alanine ligase [Candidatus Peribacteria bacterium]
MKIYCSGIGGIGLSAYAALQAASGHTVSGSDRSDSALLEDLRSQGIAVHLTQDGSGLSDDTDLFVFSEAIPADAPERVKAAELGIKSLSYFAALGELVSGHTVIAVCGTHGKSSTTAMVAKMLIDLGKDPSVVVGTKMRELSGRNWRKGASDFFVVEACEYRRSFLFINPSIVLMTNVDGDHFDAYGSLEEYRKAFVDFLTQLPADGSVITHGEDPDCVAVASASGRTMIDADQFPLVQLATPGEHMRQNARLALALADQLKIDANVAHNSLSTFAGTWRRMEVKGEMENGITLIDDYGHHPVEIRATLNAMREAYGDRRIVCVFQPHTHDRTKKLYLEFTDAFFDADLVIIPNIYVARSDIESGTVDVDTFVNDIAENSGVDAINGQSLAETENMLHADILQPGDVLITMGAGDITQLSDRLLG